MTVPVWGGRILVVSAAMFSQNRAQPFTCGNVKDSRGSNINVKMSSVANTAFCEDMPTTQDVDSLMRQCEAFCGDGLLPFLIGVPSEGFNLEDMDKVCQGDSNNRDRPQVIKHDPDLLQNCKKWSEALNFIKTRAAEFVAAGENMSYAQVEFTASIKDKVNALVDVIASEKTKTKLMNSIDSQRLATFVGIVKTNLQDFLSSGALLRGLEGVLDHYQATGNALQYALDTNMDMVVDFFDKCNVFFLATDSNNNYLLDLCNQRTDRCLGDTNARHIGCCCGADPVAGTWKITGEGADRRLAAETAETREVDICGEAGRIAAADLEATTLRTKRIPGGSDALEEYEQKVADAYPEWAQRCSSSRRLGDLASEPSVEDAPVDSTVELAARRLSVLPNCNPQESTVEIDKRVVTAFWKKTEADFCDTMKKLPPNQGELMDTRGLADVCREFCGADTVPLLIGSTGFGFNQTEMDSVCLKGSDILSGNLTAVDDCHADAGALQDVLVRTAHLIAKLNVLEAQKLKFQAAVNGQVKIMQATIKQKGPQRLKEAAKGDKINAMLDVLVEAASSSSLTAHKLDLHVASQAVRDSGVELKKVLTQSISKIKSMVSRCNSLFTAVGPSSEYLLDICSQTSKKCLDAPTGSHVGCCCGYTPLVALGRRAISHFPMPGIEAEMLTDTSGLARAARRLAVAAEDAKPYKVCPEAWQASRPQVKAITAETSKLGGDEVLERKEKQDAAAYPQLACKRSGTRATASVGALVSPNGALLATIASAVLMGSTWEHAV
mmetsp:Transcript_838/g.3415  ORF Transcript_838/g.3415 Transcript_838/m.3415 type:complete len:780 (-) Transcript_838:205-2544(-)